MEDYRKLETEKEHLISFSRSAIHKKRYSILEKIGEGGMGAVYKAKDNNLNRVVCIKKVENQTQDLVAAECEHENIIRVYDRVFHNNSCWIVMELMEMNLEEKVTKKGPLKWTEAKDIFVSLIQALVYIHNKGIVHRDIKPKNILFSKSNKVKLADFGICLTKNSLVLANKTGTKDYMSPEQKSGKVDSRSDIYSFGLTCCYALSGENNVLKSFKNFDIPSGFKVILEKMLEESLEKRYQFAKDIEEDIRKLDSSLKMFPFYRTGIEDQKNKKFLKFISSKVNRDFKKNSLGNIAWGSCVTLQNSIVGGWPVNKVWLRCKKKFKFPSEKEGEFRKYTKDNYYKDRLFDNGTKYMLNKNPISFSDSPTLLLETLETDYHTVQFYRDSLTKQERKNQLGKIQENNCIEYPHSLCFHVLLVTQNDKFLLTQRSPKVAYYSNTWSASLEEQISTKDVVEGEKKTVLYWAKRMMKEELGIESDYYHDENLKVLSVFLESEILNCCLSGIFQVDLTDKELDSILKIKPREDYEFKDWKFFSLDELISQLQKATIPFHPTSEYRIYIALLHRFGIDKLKELLIPK